LKQHAQPCSGSREAQQGDWKGMELRWVRHKKDRGGAKPGPAACKAYCTIAPGTRPRPLKTANLPSPVLQD